MHDNVVRENGIFEPFIYKKRTFCQDRLGTNIGRTQKRCLFSGDARQEAAGRKRLYVLH
jgi:hypothetical protein